MLVQSLALPVVMSGRDCIGVATTGSGKTLAYVLPMMRNVNDAVVRGLDESLGNGPLGLIIAPTRELVQQVRSLPLQYRFLVTVVMLFGLYIEVPIR